MTRARRSDWDTTPMPRSRSSISFQRAYTRVEFDRLAKGVIPGGMDDRWFIYCEEPWLHLHRSWTGHCIFQVRFDLGGESARVVETIVNRDAEEYRGTPAEDERILGWLLDLYAGRDPGPGP